MAIGNSYYRQQLSSKRR
uniref:Uncharacterized protein n=1 Tax=Arundo donax TaxID=35708 RepID=A0A0A8XZI0_ARUDO